MDNIGNAVTNEKTVLEQLVETNSKQDSNISKQAITTLALSNEVKQLQIRIINKGGRGSRGGKYDDVRKCLKDGY